jgi:hypothetical protein
VVELPRVQLADGRTDPVREVRVGGCHEIAVDEQRLEIVVRGWRPSAGRRQWRGGLGK